MTALYTFTEIIGKLFGDLVGCKGRGERPITMLPIGPGMNSRYRNDIIIKGHKKVVDYPADQSAARFYVFLGGPGGRTAIVVPYPHPLSCPNLMDNHLIPGRCTLLLFI